MYRLALTPSLNFRHVPTRLVAFQSSAPVAPPEARKAEIEAIMGRLSTAEKPLRLHREERVPLCVKPQYKQALASIDIDTFRNNANQGRLGVAEEFSDILCFVTMQHLYLKNLLPNSTLQKFLDAAPPDPTCVTPAQFIKRLAAISKQLEGGIFDFKKLRSLFANPSPPDDVLKQFVVMHGAFQLNYVSPDGLLPPSMDYRFLMRKLHEELNEFETALGKIQLPDEQKRQLLLRFKTAKDKLTRNITQDPLQHRLALGQLLSITQSALNLPHLTLNHIVQFNTWKNIGRSEVTFTHPNSSKHYKRQLTTGLEMLLEGYYILDPKSPFYTNAA